MFAKLLALYAVDKETRETEKDRDRDRETRRRRDRETERLETERLGDRETERQSRETETQRDREPERQRLRDEVQSPDLNPLGIESPLTTFPFSKKALRGTTGQPQPTPNP